MNNINKLSTYLTEGYLIAFLLNLVLFKVIKYDFSKIQDYIGRILLIGLIVFVLSYTVEFLQAWYQGVDSEQYVFVYNDSKILTWLIIQPFILILLNSFSKIRKHPITGVLNSNMYFGRIFEFYIVMMTSSVKFSNLNPVYKTPIVRMIIIGIILYCICLIWLKRNDIKLLFNRITKANSR